MPTLAEQAKARQPKATPVAEIPAVPELEMTLDTAAHGNFRNQFRGWLDEAGTVRARAYIGGDAAKLKGEVLVASSEEITHMEVIETKGGDLVKVEYRDTVQDGVLIILWAPAKASVTGVRLAL